MATRLARTFRVGEVVSNEELTRAFGRNMGGIRYLGSTNRSITRAAIIVIPVRSTGSTKRKRHPYTEIRSGELLAYMGEGLRGDQQMKRGNLALLLQAAQHYPLIVFERGAPNQYLCLGPARIVGFREDVAPDENGAPRRVFVFETKLGDTKEPSRGTQRGRPTDRASGVPLRLRKSDRWVALKAPGR